MKLNKRERIGVLVSAIWLLGVFMFWVEEVGRHPDLQDVSMLVAWWAAVPIGWLIYWVMKAK